MQKTTDAMLGQQQPAKMSYHPNFVGVPNREDIQTLEQLRRQLWPMVGVIEKLQKDMVFALNRGEAVNWPHIRHNIGTINNYLASINGYINGSYRHAEETLKDSAGKSQIMYRDYPNEGQRDRIGALHVYPQAPFPMGDERLAGMALVLLEKRLGAPEEKWVEERLRKAAEFAHVPSEWGLEALKPAVKAEEEESDDEDMKGWDAELPTKRVKGTLNEDDFMELWAQGHKTAFDKEYQGKMSFGVQDGEDMEEEEEGEGEGDEEGDEEGEEEEEEDVESPQAPAPPPVVMIQRAAPEVHKGVSGVPVMALSAVHRFMASGEVQQPAGPR